MKKDGISVTQGVKNLIERAGLPAPAGDDLVQIIGKLHSFASATHPVAKKERTVDLAVFDREDTVFVLTCIASIISTIAKKLEREAWFHLQRSFVIGRPKRPLFESKRPLFAGIYLWLVTNVTTQTPKMLKPHKEAYSLRL